MTTCTLYRHFDKDDRLLYVGISVSAAGRLAQHAQHAEWFSRITRVTMESFPSRFEAEDAERAAIQTEQPLFNKLLKRRTRVGGTKAIAFEADRSDPEDFPVDQATLDRAQMGRRIRMLRKRLGLTQEAFAERYGIPLTAIKQYEIGRNMPPPAVRAYLQVIEREPEKTAEAISAP